MGALEPGHLIVVLVIVLIIFGPGKLPQLGKAIGDGVRELKRASADDQQTTVPPSVGSSVPSADGGPPGGVDASRRCRTCQAVLPPDTRFCGSCGAPVAGTPPLGVP
jgi:sec-independent protein translocase protein TatA